MILFLAPKTKFKVCLPIHVLHPDPNAKREDKNVYI